MGESTDLMNLGGGVKEEGHGEYIRKHEVIILEGEL